MTHIHFDTPLPIRLKRHSYDVTTVPRVGEEVCLKDDKGEWREFTVYQVAWSDAREPYEGIEAEVRLSLCDEEGG